MLSKKNISYILNRKLLDIKYLIEVKNYFYNKKILITGAGGTIGSSLIKQIIHYQPNKILALDNSEISLFKLKMKFLHVKVIHNYITYILSDLRDVKNLDYVFRLYHPDIIIHTAAYKHIGLVEKFVNEGFTNNFLVTKQLIVLSLKYNIKKFIFISTDKAVYPKNILGITKRLSELFLFTYCKYWKIQDILIVIRLGNIFSSSGSVINIFMHQILNCHNLTVSHKHVERYFITKQEASFLILKIIIESINDKHLYCLYVLSLGGSIKIKDIARRIINIFKYKNNINYKIIFTKLSTYEKIKEKLLYNTEFYKYTKDVNILAVQIPYFNYKKLFYYFDFFSNQLKYYNNINVLKNISQHIMKNSYL